ncbi:hypothetical protein BYT27DRAFT_7220522 [Phlegmacium glaucopus]|nr:hypothetical protein BYT27DRAFT_7220522 [Phlegmacium glaucopus]
MSYNDSMDVDGVPKTLLPPISLSQSSPMSSSSLPPGLPQAEVDKFKKNMIETSKWEHWSSRLISAGSDKQGLKSILYSVLSSYGRRVLSQTALQKNLICLSDSEDISKLVESLNDEEVEEWKNMVQKDDWVGVITHWKLQKPPPAELAYTQGFIGNFATEFIEHLEHLDIDEETNKLMPLYAKAISVAQSSRTGKSCMLTEVGKKIFTLPICLYKSTDPGYPPGDKPVVDFFSELLKNNDLSITAHLSIACFLAAAHQTMLETLQEAYDAKGLNGSQLLQYWHQVMEPTGSCGCREVFFTKVVKQANLMKLKVETPQNSPIRGKDGEVPENFKPYEISHRCYMPSAEEATKKLMEFLSHVLPTKRICIMYFDEAHELDLQLWIFLRLVQHQPLSTKMCSTGTKSSLSYYAPPPNKYHSLRLKHEVARLPTPYIDLGFDQQAIEKSRAISACMGDMETIEFISQFGRPMWNAHLPEETPGELICLASMKLRNGRPFNATDKDHLSQHLCLDLVMATSEAILYIAENSKTNIALADRSIAHHMRLLTGLSTNSNRFFTHSPSEPVLVMGSIDILYNTTQSDLLGQVLNTLSEHLCGAGLVEKGILGELGARTLILIARDFTAPLHSSHIGRNLLKPVLLLDFLRILFGRDIFSPSDKEKFDNAFGKAYVNFMHWISTQDPIPEQPSMKLLANLWARGAALQCCFSQESIDLIIPLYCGSIHPDSNFDPAQFSAVVIQIKYKSAGDTNAEPAIRPIGVVRDHNGDQPLPYLAMLMELAAAEEYEAHCRLKNTPKAILTQCKKKAKDAQLAVDSCNRYSISVRGISVDEYGILREAKIADQFATLLSIIMPLHGKDKSTRKNMRPLERLSDPPHIAWMSDYYVPDEEMMVIHDTDNPEADVILV